MYLYLSKYAISLTNIDWKLDFKSWGLGQNLKYLILIFLGVGFHWISFPRISVQMKQDWMRRMIHLISGCHVGYADIRTVVNSLWQKKTLKGERKISYKVKCTFWIINYEAQRLSIIYTVQIELFHLNVSSKGLGFLNPKLLTFPCYLAWTWRQRWMQYRKTTVFIMNKHLITSLLWFYSAIKHRS